MRNLNQPKPAFAQLPEAPGVKSPFKLWIFGLCEPSVRLSLQGKIVAFTTPQFQILNRL
jgi:hypothetical protein